MNKNKLITKYTGKTNSANLATRYIKQVAIEIVKFQNLTWQYIFVRKFYCI